MQINITARDFGGTEFLAQPHRLHLGAQKAEGVDQLEFSLPEQWNGCVVTLHIRHADGTLAEPLALDEAGCVGVGRSFTGWASGEWMLAAANGNGYTAYTRPGQYDVHGILPTEGGGEELTPSIYEQFIARVVDSANAAAEAAKRAASGEANAKQSASEAAVSAQQTAASATLAAGYAEQAEAAADRAASYAPSEGAVLSVNGKSGAVRLNALDVWALPRPVSPKVGQLVRVVKVDASTGALTVDTISTDSLSGLGSEEKELLLKLLGSVSYTDSSAKMPLRPSKTVGHHAAHSPARPGHHPGGEGDFEPAHAGTEPGQHCRPQRLHRAPGRHRPDGIVERFADGHRLGGCGPRHCPQEGFCRRHCHLRQQERQLHRHSDSRRLPHRDGPHRQRRHPRVGHLSRQVRVLHAIDC